jgi:hypothetical protein
VKAGASTSAAEADLRQLVMSERHGMLATAARDGKPQLSNVLYDHIPGYQDRADLDRR